MQMFGGQVLNSSIAEGNTAVYTVSFCRKTDIKNACGGEKIIGVHGTVGD